MSTQPTEAIQAVCVHDGWEHLSGGTLPCDLKPLPEHLFAEPEAFIQYVTFIFRPETRWWERWTEHRDPEAAREAAKRQVDEGRSVVILQRTVRCRTFTRWSP
jgi:hypothetical protein